MKTISIVTPFYNEEQNLRECYERVKAVFSEKLPGYQREHIFCDNASEDGSLAIIKEIAASDSSVKIIVNARNFGALRSNYNGVMAATGDIVLLFLPADLQDPPELLPEFIALYEQGYDVVYGIRKVRQESILMRNVRKIYYTVLTKFSELDVPIGVGDFQVVDRKVVDAMRQISDSYPFMRMMTFECGFKAIGVPYTWGARKKGFTKNNLPRLVDEGINGLVTFTPAPLRAFMFAGFVIAALAVLYAVYNALLGIFYYQKLAPVGTMTIISALFFFGGVQLLATGILAEYVLAVYAQVRRKPVVFERERVNFTAPKSDQL